MTVLRVVTLPAWQCTVLEPGDDDVYDTPCGQVVWDEEDRAFTDDLFRGHIVDVHDIPPELADTVPLDTWGERTGSVHIRRFQGWTGQR